MAKKNKEEDKPKDVFGNYYDPSRTYEALKNASLLPEWAKIKPWKDSAAGTYQPDTNSLIAKEPTDLNLGNLKKTASERSTLSHEMSHAVQYNLLKNMASNIMEKQWKGGEVTPQEKQFVQAASKLFGEQYGTMGQYSPIFQNQLNKNQEAVAQALYKNKENPNYDAYRMQPIEAQSHGIGSMTQGGEHGSQIDYPYNPHLDPSFATEFDILLSMYQGLPKGVRTLSEQQRINSINKERNSPFEGQRSDYTFENVFNNPFTSTIK